MLSDAPTNASIDMKLFVIPRQNFGDQLNLLLFPRLLGPIFDEDARHLVLGIGTVIRARARRRSHEIILGAGAGYQGGRHSLERRTVYAVRGPLTARRLGIPERLAGIDPGILVPRVMPASRESESAARPAFMPHYQTDRVSSSAWRRACALAEVDYICPVEDTGIVAEQLRRAPLLITEALHGAVVAESYGIPWIPVVLGPKVLTFKWRDWCASIGVEYRPNTALPVLLDPEHPIGLKNHFRRMVGKIGIGKAAWRFIASGASTSANIEEAAAVLKHITDRGENAIHRGSPAAVARGTERLLAALEEFGRDLAADRFAAKP
jgi:succinoglycan biosynthesis protein ExoV